MSNNDEDSIKDTGCIATTATTIHNNDGSDNDKRQHGNNSQNKIILNIRHFGRLTRLQQEQQQPQQPYEDFMLPSSPAQCKHNKGRYICYQILILIILFLFVIRIQIINCNALLKEYPNEHSTKQKQLPSPPQGQENDRTGTLIRHTTPRILVGIFSMNNDDGYMYRQRHRTLFQTWNDTRICSLSEYNLNLHHEKDVCVFVYTFVIGANPDGATELLQVRDDNLVPNTNDRNIATSWLVPPSTIRNHYPNPARDIENPDITLLNIRENMNAGKSQSWIAYSSTVLAVANKDHGQYDFDYIAKWDADSIILLPEYFHFASTNLPSQRPYNSMFLVGTPFDKAHWEQSDQTQADHDRVESLYENQYNRVHVYVGGQLYIMSIDLAQLSTEEAIRHHCSYCEGVEDHDIASIAFHATSKGHTDTGSSNDDHDETDTTDYDSIDKIDDPHMIHPLIKLIFVGRHQQFWEHPIKTNDEWEAIWQRERQRISVLQ